MTMFDYMIFRVFNNFYMIFYYIALKIYTNIRKYQNFEYTD